MKGEFFGALICKSNFVFGIKNNKFVNFVTKIPSGVSLVKSRVLSGRKLSFGFK